MQGIYTYIPEANYVPRQYSVVAVLLLLFMVLIPLVPVLNLLYFYISTFRSMCAVSKMAFSVIIIIITHLWREVPIAGLGLLLFFRFRDMYVLSSKIENAHWAEKTTTTRCGITETTTMRNFGLWLFVNNRNALWHVKICRDAEVVLWLLKEMSTTSSDFMKMPQTAQELAYQLMDIFCMFGAPFILQSDNGREFANKIIQNLADVWPGMKLVRGKSRHSQSQGSVERSNQDVRDMLIAWVSDNNTKTWSEGLRFIQSKKHRSAFRHQDKPLWGYALERRTGSDLGIL